MTFPGTASSIATWISAGLAIVAVALFAALGLVILAGFWVAFAVLIAWVIWTLRGTPQALRVSLAIGLVPVFVLLATVGGLYFIAPALASIVAQACAPLPQAN